MSALVLGCLGYDNPREIPDGADMIVLVHKAVDRGVDLIDTAESYGPPRKTIGTALMA